MKRILILSVFACFQLLSFGQVSISQEVEELYQTGCNYRDGKNGVTKDLEKALEYFTKAAVQNHASAQVDLGDCYYYGKGVTKDNFTAVYWYRKAAEQGNASAQYILGDCYYYGYGVEKNFATAVEWYRKVANQGNASAQYSLGNCYLNGWGVTKNYATAVEWYRKAANQGHTDAQNGLGDCYYYGYGVTKNYATAVEWYRKAAEQGNASAQSNLGYCYLKGEGIAKNTQKAIELYEKAAAAGNESASKALENIRHEKLVANFKKKYGFDPSVNDVKYIVKVGRNILNIVDARNEWVQEYSDNRNAKVSVKLSIDHGTSKCYDFYWMNGAYYMGFFWVKNNVITSVSWK